MVDYGNLESVGLREIVDEIIDLDLKITMLSAYCSSHPDVEIAGRSASEFLSDNRKGLESLYQEIDRRDQEYANINDQLSR